MNSILMEYDKFTEKDIKEMKIKYFGMFNDLPPNVYAFGENHPAMLYLMDIAVANEKPIKMEDIEKIMDKFNIQTDLIEENANE